MGTGLVDSDRATAMMREAAWVARCVGRGEAAPLRSEDVAAMAHALESRRLERDGVLCREGERFGGVWIIREGSVAVTVGAGEGRTVIHILRPGDVDGDIQLLLDMPMPYTARALTTVQYLYLSSEGFDRVIQRNSLLARRWMSSIAMRLASSQQRILGLLGRSLNQQVARVLVDESEHGTVHLTQGTIAAMLGARRPSVNKVLGGFQDMGLVTLSYGKIVIHDRESLALLT